MSIQHRRGDIKDFDPSKMKPAEWAFPSDGTARYCVEPGMVKTAATTEDLQSLLDSTPEAYSALKQCIADLGNNPSELTSILSNISALQNGKLDKTGDSSNNVAKFTENSSDVDIMSGETHATLFGKILKSIKTLRNGKINTSDITQTTATNDSTKVPSSAVTNGIAQSVQMLNDNLAVKYINNTTSTAQALIEAYYATMSDNTYKIVTIRPSDENRCALIIRYLSTYGVYVEFLYGGTLRYHSMANGIWTTKTVTLS
jgi:hypothetical protein